jgi:hypothetical protein
MALISSIFLSLYTRQLRQSLLTFEISPSRSHRKSVALEISKSSQISWVLYLRFDLDLLPVVLCLFNCIGESPSDDQQRTFFYLLCSL